MLENPVKPLSTFKNQDKEIKKIFMTYEYEKFKTLQGNRIVSKSNLMRITQSMKEKHLISPIAVNEKFEIIDGQHRFAASKEIGLPVYYFILDGANLPDVQRLNAVSKNWNFVDYLSSYCELGYPEYMKVKRFREDFPDFGIKACLALLSLSLGTHIQKKVGTNRDGSKHLSNHSFSDGNFKCANLQRSYELASQLTQLKPITDLYNKSNFVGAYVQVSRKNQFDYRNFKYKAQKYPSKFYDCTSTQNFVAMFEEVYNYKNRSKLNLRF